MKRRTPHAGRWLALASYTLPAALFAQTHVVKKPETVVRAVGVYEWTGDPDGKATASRVMPVSIFIDGRLEDAGVYLARPIPFALDQGTVFEMQHAGVAAGTIELAYARHLLANDAGTPLEDGWLAVGGFRPQPKEAVSKLQPSSSPTQVVVSGGKGPHFGTKSPAPDERKSDPAPTPVDRSSAAGGGAPVSADPQDKSDAGNDPAERPTLKRRSGPPPTKQEAKAEQKKRDSASVTGGGTSLNDDPDRPNLHRGKPAARMEEEDLPTLKGLPVDMHQAVVVSDAKTREEHPFARAWESDAERAEVLSRLCAIAQQRLAAYERAAPPPPPAHIAAPASAAAKARVRRSAPATPAPQLGLTGESLSGYTLSYGGAPTFVYRANAPGPTGSTATILLVAQREPLGELKVALASVTDSLHLDRTPAMRLIDAVDAEASNRASLLLELRAQTTRQFALYRVIGAQAEQTLLTGTTE